jgi:NADH:ubiquinone oxidoreductase subunit 3 (subunit A)
MNQPRDYVALKFSFTSGIEYPDDIDGIYGVSQEIKDAAKDCIKNDINKNKKKYTMNPFIFCLFPLGMVLFMVGGVTAAFFFPYNFILVALGFLTFLSTMILVVYKSMQVNKFYGYAEKVFAKKTNRELRLIPIYQNTLYNRKRGLGVRRNCTHFLVKTKTSTMTAAAFLAGKSSPIIAQLQNLHNPNYNPVNPPLPMNPPINNQNPRTPFGPQFPQNGHMQNQFAQQRNPPNQFPISPNQNFPQPPMSPQPNSMNLHSTNQSVNSTGMRPQHIGNNPSSFGHNPNMIPKQNNIKPMLFNGNHPNMNLPNALPPNYQQGMVPFQNSTRQNRPLRMYPPQNMMDQKFVNPPLPNQKYPNQNNAPLTNNSFNQNQNMMNNTLNMSNKPMLYSPNPQNVEPLNEKKKI